MTKNFGNFPKIKQQQATELYFRDEIIPFQTWNLPVLPYGQGKSYGDSCLNENGILINTRNLNRFIQFDMEKGEIVCESGVLLSEILVLIIKKGWFLPVLPGTKWVSIGGAIANDIHGKNHHSAGSFGNYVLNFELLRSDGKKYFCSPYENVELFQATIGGLGLTGLILSATLKLKPLHSTMLEVEQIPFNNLEEFFYINEHSENQFEYTVAWLDCLSKGKKFGRGIFMRANNCSSNLNMLVQKNKFRLSIPVYFPNFILNEFTTKVFNHIYFNKKRGANRSCLLHYEKFFFPLDGVDNWNRIYGSKGFIQYQCVIPYQNQHKINNILKMIVASGLGSFLSVLKSFGDQSSQGLLSFPMKGITLALDFPYRGKKTLSLLDKLDDLTMELEGRVYPAKDSRMKPDAFKKFFPMYKDFLRLKDPQFSSSFWRRVTNES